MTIEKFSEKIKFKERNVERLKEYIKHVDRMNSIVFRYHKTEDYMGNHGYVEGDNSFSVAIEENNSGLLDSCFDELKAQYLQMLRDKLAKAENELEAMKKKKVKIEEWLSEEP